MQDMVLQKFIDFEKIERTGTREIVPIDEKRFATFSFSTYSDRSTGTTYGVPIGKNQDGTYRFKKFIVTGRTFFNLENEEEARAWAVIKNLPIVLGSKFQKGKPLLRVYDRVEEARATVQKFTEAQDALKIALKLDGEELYDFARILGVTVANTEPIVVKQLLSEKAQKNPGNFMASYSDQNRGVFQVFKRAMDSQLITHRIDAGYLFKDTVPLGDSEVAVIAYLLKERKLLTNIDIESRKILSERGTIYKIQEDALVDVKQEVSYAPTVAPSENLPRAVTEEDIIAKLKAQGYELVKKEPQPEPVPQKEEKAKATKPKAKQAEVDQEAFMPE